MARLALPGAWAKALARQRGPLRTYQWIWLLLCTAGALLAAAPRILSRPLIFTSASAVAVAPERSYARLANPGDADFAAVGRIAIGLLQTKAEGDRAVYPGLDTPERAPTLNVRFVPQGGGRVLVAATAPSPAEAQRLADDGAEALARSIRAAGGREIFRRLAGWEQFAAFSSAAPRTQFQEDLRQILRYEAFQLNTGFDVEPEPFTVDQLPPEDLSDLARALEVREQELTTVDLPAAARRLAEAAPEQRELLASSIERQNAGLAAIRGALAFLYGEYGARFDPSAPSAVYRSAAAQPGAEIARYTAPLLALATLVGLVFGGVGVAVDRSAGVMAKLRELWAYRELIVNLVLRDLRVRYKGSALGYLWTQLAPLLLMLVFWFVFSRLQPSAISMFPVFLIVGLLAWNFCNEAVVGGARSVIDNGNLIKKVFFPREVLPLVSVLSSLLNYLLSLPMMFLLIALVQLATLGRLNFRWTVAYLPVLLIIQTMLLSGLALLMSALAVRFRDFVHLIGILMQFWFFLTPVVYSLDALNATVAGVPLAAAVRWLNPMASLIEFYREILYGQAVPAPNVPTPGLPALDSVLRVLVTALAALTIGYWVFQRRSGSFGEDL